MFIPSPHAKPDDPLYELHCEFVLAPEVTAIIQAAPVRRWEGCEPELLPLRQAARDAGWSSSAIDHAIAAILKDGRQAAVHTDQWA